MMIDALLHFLLGIAIAATAAAAFLLLGPVMAAGVVGAWDIYFREVTQQQAKYHGFDFRQGWNPADWSAAKNFETWLPVAGVLAVTLALQWVLA